MSIGYEVIWSDKAKYGVSSTVSYLEKRWSSKEADNFLAHLNRRISLISKHPKLFPLVEDTEYTRYSVLNKQITIYYEFKNNILEILFLFDTRQNPIKLDF